MAARILQYSCVIFLPLICVFAIIVQPVTTEDSSGCICLEKFASGLRDPVLAVHSNDETHRLFVAEQIGVVYVYKQDKSRLQEPFLDLQSQVLVDPNSYDERGFLGLAFHPNHAENRKLYVYYTTKSEAGFKVRLSEFKTLADNENKVDEESERFLLEVEEPEMNHNGGQILFGIDGYLYVSLGDGGGGGDQHGEIGNGQNLTTLLAKVLRIDVDHTDGVKPYAIPNDNPFVNEDDKVKRHEIYAYGARNMWRCSVDRGHLITGADRGRLFCADVGQNLYEEVDIIVNGGNYGWRGKEGYKCYDEDLCYNLENEVLPIDVYDHNVGQSVTGGYVYRGDKSTSLQGKYIYGDYVNGRVFTLTENDKKWTREDMCFASDDICKDGLVNTYPVRILSFGEDEAGEVYMLTTDQAEAGNPGGEVYRIVDSHGKWKHEGNMKADHEVSDEDGTGRSRAPWIGALWASLFVVIVAAIAVILNKRYNANKQVVKSEMFSAEADETSPLASM